MNLKTDIIIAWKTNNSFTKKENNTQNVDYVQILTQCQANSYEMFNQEVQINTRINQRKQKTKKQKLDENHCWGERAQHEYMHGHIPIIHVIVFIGARCHSMKFEFQQHYTNLIQSIRKEKYRKENYTINCKRNISNNL